MVGLPQDGSVLWSVGVEVLRGVLAAVVSGVRLGAERERHHQCPDCRLAAPSEVFSRGVLLVLVCTSFSLGAFAGLVVGLVLGSLGACRRGEVVRSHRDERTVLFNVRSRAKHALASEVHRG